MENNGQNVFQVESLRTFLDAPNRLYIKLSIMNILVIAYHFL